MARPSLVAVGALAQNTSGNLSPSIPTHQANDILVARVVYWGPNTAGSALDIPTPASWTLQGSQGGGDDARHATFYIRAAGAGTTVTFTRGVSWDTGTDTKYFARVAVIRNCKTSGTPYTYTTQGTETAANAVWLALTGSADRLHLMFCGWTDDIAAPSLSGYAVDHGSTATDMGGAITVLTKDVDTDTESGGNLTSGAPAQGNYRVEQFMFIPALITGARTDSPLTLDRVVSGAYTRRGVVAQAFNFNIFAHAWQQHYAAFSLGMTLERVTAGQSVIFGRTDGLAINIERQVTANLTRAGRSSLEMTLNSQVIGRGSFHAIAAGLDMVVGLVTVGNLPLALGVLTENSLTLTPISPEDAQTLTLMAEDAQTLTALEEVTYSTEFLWPSDLTFPSSTTYPGEYGETTGLSLDDLDEDGLTLTPFHERED